MCESSRRSSEYPQVCTLHAKLIFQVCASLILPCTTVDGKLPLLTVSEWSFNISGLQSLTERERENFGQRSEEMFKCDRVEYERETPDIRRDIY